MSIKHILPFFILFLAGCSKPSVDSIHLAGQWQFQIDPDDKGIAEKWFSASLDDSITLPGSMTVNGKGYEISMETQWTGTIIDSSWYFDEKYAAYRKPGNIKVPFWLQPDKYYVGSAWYAKAVEIPTEWQNRHIELFLERCHWETRVWVDGREAGMQNGLATPHIYDLSEFLSPGKHTITIRVDNRVKDIDPGINSHSITDHTQSNWNSIAGQIMLRTMPEVFVDDLRVFPDVERGVAIVRGTVRNTTGKEIHGKMAIFTALNSPGADPPKQMLDEELTISIGESTFEYETGFGDELGIWDEFYPNLYTMVARLETPAGIHEKEVIFGMRDFRTEGTRFVINGRPVFLRGTLDCAIFPKTGYPPTDTASWKKIIKTCKSHGLNHIRFHSWCPPEAAFIAADELGFYLQVECSSWANQSSAIGDGKPIDQWIYDESERIVRAYGNHPSFVMMAYGNEPAGRNRDEYLADFVDHWKTKDDRRVYTGGAGWPVLMENDYHNIPQPRIQGWGEGLRSIINSQPPATDFDWSQKIEPYDVPVVSHEIGQWCVYPNFKEIDKYDGVLKPKNFEIFRDMLNANGMRHLADSFQLASGKLQALCYKAEIEAALRTPGFAGFQLLSLQDFPGQGTALVGILDPFWEEKGYITPREFRRFCNTTVPLARMKKRVFFNDETLVAGVQIAHFGPEILPETAPAWQISNAGGKVLYSGMMDTVDITFGNLMMPDSIVVSLHNIKTPQKLTLTVGVAGFENGWDIWVYPKKSPKNDDILMTNSLNAKALQHLRQGGAVLWSIRESTKHKNLDDAIGFSSIFWNTAWTKGQKPHSLGILCDPRHPALAAFPTEFHSNWQWWDAMSHSNALILDDFPANLQPIVRVIDDWFTARREALLIEVKVGKGKLLISGVDFFENIDKRPAGIQLLRSLRQYMAGDRFDPEVEMDYKELKTLLSLKKQ